LSAFDEQPVSPRKVTQRAPPAATKPVHAVTAAAGADESAEICADDELVPLDEPVMEEPARTPATKKGAIVCAHCICASRYRVLADDNPDEFRWSSLNEAVAQSAALIAAPHNTTDADDAWQRELDALESIAARDVFAHSSRRAPAPAAAQSTPAVSAKAVVPALPARKPSTPVSANTGVSKPAIVSKPQTLAKPGECACGVSVGVLL
jgi:hypothetical protein